MYGDPLEIMLTVPLSLIPTPRDTKDEGNRREFEREKMIHVLLPSIYIQHLCEH